jgi:hypothetical protein
MCFGLLTTKELDPLTISKVNEAPIHMARMAINNEQAPAATLLTCGLVKPFEPGKPKSV